MILKNPKPLSKSLQPLMPEIFKNADFSYCSKTYKIE